MCRASRHVRTSRRARADSLTSPRTGAILFSAAILPQAVWSWRLKVVNCESSKKARRANLRARLSTSPSAVAARAPISQDIMYVTERCVIKLEPAGLTVTEIAPGVDLQRDVLAQADIELRVSPNLKTMDARLFKPETDGVDDRLTA